MQTDSSDSPGVYLLPPIAFLLFLVAGGVVEYLYPSYTQWLAGWLHVIVGAGVMVGGFYILASAFHLFMVAGTDPLTTRPATVLVTSGVFQYSRNPMYIGEISFFVGIGILSGSYWICLAAVLFGLYLRYYVIRREEAYLLRAFGEEYVAYRKKVRRWL